VFPYYDIECLKRARVYYKFYKNKRLKLKGRLTMAYKDFDSLDFGQIVENTSQTLQIDGPVVQLPDASFVRDADMSRDGVDLVLEGPSGTIIVEGYFAAEPAPQLTAPDGATLTPDLVESFLKAPAEYAANGTLNDASPVGHAAEVTGEATVTRVDGSVETITNGTPIFEGDIIETKGDGAVNITFIDETSFAISEDARLAIDEYVFDPATQSGTQNFSVLKGLFVFTSGLIGRDDPDDVEIETPAGSIGIRGTIIAGDATTGEITVVEGAIVLRDLKGNEMTLANRFETAKFDDEDGIENMGEMSAEDMADRFSSVSNVSPSLFSSIQDSRNEQNDGNSGESGQDGRGDDGPSLPDPGAGNGLEGDNGGLGGSSGSGSGDGGGSSGAGSGGSTGSSTSGSGGGDPPPPPSGGEPPPPPPPSPPSPPPINLAPVYHGVPSNHPVFAGAEGMVWEYSFGKSFHDPDGPQAGMTFSLSAETQDFLATMLANGLLEGVGYEFDSITGKLKLFFSDNGLGAGSGFEDFTFSVIATDGGGVSTAFNFDFTAFNADTIISGDQIGAPIYISVSNEVTTISADAYNYSSIEFLGGDGHRLFVDGNGAAATINVDAGNNNFIHLSEGDNLIRLSEAQTETTVIGGHGNEAFEINGLNNSKLFGMDGNDIFKLQNIDAINDLMNAGSNVIEGGMQGQIAAHEILRDLREGITPESMGLPLGDTLKIATGANVTIDFRVLFDAGNAVHGIEALDLSATTNETVILSQQNIIDMTGPDNILVIKFEDGDNVQIEDWGSSDFTQMNNEAENGVNIDGQFYDVWHNTETGVTLFIQQNGAGGDAGTVSAIP
jgi:hypothetical protein